MFIRYVVIFIALFTDAMSFLDLLIRNNSELLRVGCCNRYEIHLSPALRVLASTSWKEYWKHSLLTREVYLTSKSPVAFHYKEIIRSSSLKMMENYGITFNVINQSWICIKT